MKFDTRSLLIKLLYLFLATDIVFIILHLIYSYSSFTSNYSFSLEADRGYSEIFQYIKEYWIALILGLLAVQKRSFLYLSWSLLFFYLLLDDSAQIHEKLGAYISVRFAFSPAFGLRAVDLGEIVVSASVALFFLVCIAMSYRFSDRAAKKASKSLIVMLFALAVFGIVVDMVHIAIQTPLIDPLLIALEDGGELVVMSLIATFAFWLLDHSQAETDTSKGLDRKIPVGLLSKE